MKEPFKRLIAIFIYGLMILLFACIVFAVIFYMPPWGLSKEANGARWLFSIFGWIISAVIFAGSTEQIYKALINWEVK